MQHCQIDTTGRQMSISKIVVPTRNRDMHTILLRWGQEGGWEQRPDEPLLAVQPQHRLVLRPASRPCSSSTPRAPPRALQRVLCVCRPRPPASHKGSPRSLK